MSDPHRLESTDYEAASLMAEHPPVLRHPHKRLVFDWCCEAGYKPSGIVKYSRWNPTQLPEALVAEGCRVTTHPGFFDYAPSAGIVWHVNFADPHLFVAYGSGLLAQDEIQVLEHPILGSLREALLAANREPRTDGRTGPTPVLVQNAERVCAIDTSPSDFSPRGLYGNRFQAASPEAVRKALSLFPVPTRTNLIAMAAPTGSGRYSRQEIESILVTAHCGFRAAVMASATRPVEIHTGFWGCGAFGGNRPLMVMLQLLAARLADVDQLVFHLGSMGEQPAFDEGRETLRKIEQTEAAGGLTSTAQKNTHETSVNGLIDGIVKCGFRWGQSDGN